MQNKTYLHTRPFNIEISTNSEILTEQLLEVYPIDLVKQCSTPNDFFDFSVTFNKSRFGLSKDYAFKLGHQHFRYASDNSLLPVFEWGFNWLVSGFTCSHLILHAAVVEKNGISIVLPAPPGSGKSTMCALLMLNGWRLLSDEHCLIDLNTRKIIPFVRPISLKNKSIDVLANEYSLENFSKTYSNTLKGRMRYLKPTCDSWIRADQECNPQYIVFPKYSTNCNLKVTSVRHADLFERLIRNSFNYTVLGELGFNTLADLLPNLVGFDLTYSRNSEMLSWVEQLT